MNKKENEYKKVLNEIDKIEIEKSIKCWYVKMDCLIKEAWMQLLLVEHYKIL